MSTILRVALVSCCLILFLVAPPQTLADGPVTIPVGNHDFEEGSDTSIPSWTRGAGDNGALSVPYAGSSQGQSFHYPCADCTGSESVTYQAVDVSAYAGQTLEVSVLLLKTCPAGDGPSSSDKFLAAVIGSGGDCVSAIGATTTIGLGETIAPSSTWVPFSGSVSVPPVGSGYTLCLYLVGDDDVLYFDDVTVTSLGNPTAVGMNQVSATQGNLGLAVLGAALLMTARAILGNHSKRFGSRLL